MPWLRGSDYYRRAPLRAVSRALAFTLRELRGGEQVFRTPDGLMLASMPNNFSSFAMYAGGSRDPEFWRFIQRWVKPGGVFVDAGANIGAYTIPAAQLVGAAGKVISFEAHPVTFGFLQRSIALNGFTNVLPHNQALGAEPGHVTMAFDTTNPGETHVAADGTLAGRDVPMVTLDQALAALQVLNVDYLKVDVEGFELPVLRGAAGTIAASPGIAVQTELVERHAARYGHRLADIESLLRGLGLTPHRAGHDGTPSPIAGPVFGEVVWFRA